jgi:hypothetical protein
MTATTKRANFDLSPDQEELLAHLRAQLAASSTKEAVLRAVQARRAAPKLGLNIRPVRRTGVVGRLGPDGWFEFPIRCTVP